MTVRGSEESVEARLRSGLVVCWCGGTLRPWGRARLRRVVTFAGLAMVQPRRGICRDGCGRSHVLLPAWLLSRRKYAAAVIFTALALRAAGFKVSAVAPAAAAGAGRGRRVVERPGLDGQLVAVPVRRAGRVAAGRAAEAAAAGRPAGPPVAAAGSPSADALAALEAVTAGLRRRFGGLDKLAAHEVAAHLTGGLLLAPPLPALAGNTTLIAMAAVPPS